MEHLASWMVFMVGVSRGWRGRLLSPGQARHGARFPLILSVMMLIFF
jgi:hypothetical protein